MFCLLFIDYLVRIRRSPNWFLVSRSLKIFLHFLFLSVLFIFNRCAYRIQELSEGYFSALFRDQTLFIALESRQGLLLPSFNDSNQSIRSRWLVLTSVVAWWLLLYFVWTWLNLALRSRRNPSRRGSKRHHKDRSPWRHIQMPGLTSQTPLRNNKTLYDRMTCQWEPQLQALYVSLENAEELYGNYLN